MKIVCYDRMDVSEGFDDNKTSASKECGVSHCWYFWSYSFKFQQISVIDVMIY